MTGQRARIIIPVKGFAAGKTRLADVLGESERAALMRRLTEHAIDVARDLADVHTTVVSPDPEVLALARDREVAAIRQTGSGLNQALAEATAALAEGRTVILPADLPLVSGNDVEAHIGCDGVGLSPDRHGTGTNMLSLPSPRAIPFRFGRNSLSAHMREAEKAGLPVHLIRRPALAFDLDTRDDLTRLKDWP